MLSQSGDSQSTDSWEYRTADTDDLEINDLDMFDTNEGSQDDVDSSSNSEDETYESSPVPRRHKARGSSLHVHGGKGNVMSSRGSYTSLQSADDSSAFSRPKRWKNSEQLAATSWEMGEDSGACSLTQLTFGVRKLLSVCMKLLSDCMFMRMW